MTDIRMDYVEEDYIRQVFKLRSITRNTEVIRKQWREHVRHISSDRTERIVRNNCQVWKCRWLMR